MTDPRRIQLLTITLLALVVVACGDDDSGGNRGTPLRILITNDDGVAAAGIDAIVRALVADPGNDVIVCAPDGNRSGSSDMTGPSTACGDLTVTAAATLGGYPATAIDGCPADAVLYALANLYPNDLPHVVISGSNAGQNASRAVATRVSGTVGAARTAARSGVPALAASQGVPPIDGVYDYPAGVDAVLVWLDENRNSLLTDTGMPEVTSINVPSCAAGTAIRGTLAGLPLAESTAGALNPQNCASTLEKPQSDLEALLNGFITLTSVPLEN